ncbi:helicase C-terminal domain-containing protein [Agromyces indicus]|uniref:Helicase C-terminal domain-containing protein n=1 Tax=Agromyces indicus TaxID=758919 RepID=A0ABU1FMR9_9MICO|nr:helicase C-terminal domain-containing protein [Agromyces indicus]MDR5692751.1 helicase C-terminal domain-containing protein [Agromyces indicus]
MDFDALLRESDADNPTEPRELYEQLEAKVPGYGYLRDVQAQVLEPWHDRRDERDLVVKVNTGGGKTIDALVILQSYLNEGIVPALYVAPDKYLVDQVVREAGNLGLEVTTDPESSEYLAGEAIGVVTAARLFNGRTIFSENRPSKPQVPIGAVVIDDAHVAIATLRSQFSLVIDSANDGYQALLELFEEDLQDQAPDVLLDIRAKVGNSFARVPFWAVENKIDDLRQALRKYKPADERDGRLDAIRDVLPFCRIVFTPSAVTIVPPCPPINRVTSFAEAQRRIYLTATLANDSVLVGNFDADPDQVAKPIQPKTAGDIGERMILAPQEINPGISEDEVRQAIVALSSKHNVLALVPSTAAMDRWGTSAVRADAGNLSDVVKAMRAGHVGLVVAANKYDGIDLPQDACRIVVLDGLPQAFSGDERLESLMTRSTGGIDDRQIQRLEQGMGRAVRSNEDHCVVFLLGRRLAQLTVDPKTLARFSPATAAQLKLSRTLAKRMADTPLTKILETTQQALDRDEGWTKVAKRALRNLAHSPARVDPIAAAEREAFDRALDNQRSKAVAILTEAADACEDLRTKGRLYEQAAAYAHSYDPAQAQTLVAIGRSTNPYVVRPLSGITYEPISYAGSQADVVSQRLTSMYGTPERMRVAVEELLEQLKFDPETTEEFEQAMLELGLFLGFGSQRPEQETKSGPDNLWAVAPGNYWVIEAKSGAKSSKVGKTDAAQLAISMEWFGKRYIASESATPIMVHPAYEFYKDATAPSGTRVITESVLAEIRVAVRQFSVGLVTTGWSKPEDVGRLIAGHELDHSGLLKRMRSARGGS